MTRATRALCLLPATVLSLSPFLRVGAGEDDVTRDRRYNAVAWVQNAAEYKMAAKRAYRLARIHLDKGLADKNWTAVEAQEEAVGYQEKPPAIILDVDETVLDNSPYSASGIVAGAEFSIESWNAWVALPNPMYGGWADVLGSPRGALDTATGSRRLRVATYNIRWLSSATTHCGSVAVTDVREQTDQFGTRLTRLRTIVEALNADVIALQEIRDRKALELIFGTDGRWTLVIDDDSSDCQDLALAVRKPLTVAGATDNKLNADDEHFLFEDASGTYFPGSRDILDVEIRLPGDSETVHVLVHHAKSRSGGRAKTNDRRAGASKLIVQRLKQDFADKYYVLLGDFNDGPDDQSLNILEAGDGSVKAKMENSAGAFLINLSESLVAQDVVSHGRSWSNVSDGKIDLVQPGSRQKNFDGRNSNAYDHTLDVLLDQILVPRNVHPFYVQGSIRVFDDSVGVSGQGDARASDHLPVIADFQIPAGN